MSEFEFNSVRKESYPTWPVPVANWRPQISVENNQLNMAIAYKVASADKLQPNPTVDSNDIGVRWEGVFSDEFPDVAGLPAPQLFQSRESKDLPLPVGFFNEWDTNIINAILLAAKKAGADTPADQAQLRSALIDIGQGLRDLVFTNEISVKIETMGGCLPPVSEQSSFIGELPPSFDQLLQNTFVIERDDQGRILQGDAQQRLAYNQRLNIRQDWVSTATHARNIAGSIYNRGPAVQGVQVQFPSISTSMDSSYLQPYAQLSGPNVTNVPSSAPSSRKFTNETGQNIVIPGASYLALNKVTSPDDVPDVAIKNLPKCYQLFASPNFGRDQMYDLQRKNPNIFGARGNKSNKFFSVQPRSANSTYATFQRSHIRAPRRAFVR